MHGNPACLSLCAAAQHLHKCLLVASSVFFVAQQGMKMMRLRRRKHDTEQKRSRRNRHSRKRKGIQVASQVPANNPWKCSGRLWSLWGFHQHFMFPVYVTPYKITDTVFGILWMFLKQNSFGFAHHDPVMSGIGIVVSCCEPLNNSKPAQLWVFWAGIVCGAEATASVGHVLSSLFDRTLQKGLLLSDRNCRTQCPTLWINLYFA